MSQKDRKSSADFDRARDELFSHIHRCGVLKATVEQQEEWMDDTMEFLAERYPELSREQFGELRTMGLRFCRPVIQHASSNETEEGSGNSAEAAAA